MLEPQTRATLTDQLRPPSGYELDYAVGTTFTLDLATALTVPLSFAAHRVGTAGTTSDGAPDQLGVLDALRRASDRVDIFAQAGEISMGARSDLVAFLETMVHPVTAPHGIFHPKVWFLRYRSGTDVTHRFICASRNLTDDHSWDALVRLDEVSAAAAVGADAAERNIAVETNAPLVRLLTALPGLCVQPMERRRRRRLESLAASLSEARWETPPQLRDLAFHVAGLGPAALPDFSGRRSLIISPFLSDDALGMLRKNVRTRTHVLSRAESLDRLATDSLDGRLSTYVLDDAATLPDDTAHLPDDTDPMEPEPTVGPTSAASSARRLSGLHAKAIVVDRTGGSHVMLGSANATGAAWHRNVEMMVEFTGSTGAIGVEATLAALGELKVDYPTGGGAEPSADDQAGHRLDAAVRSLAALRITARLHEADPYALQVWADPDCAQTLARAVADGFTLSWHPLTRPDLTTRGLATGEADATLLGALPLTDVTPFIVLTLCDTEGRERHTILVARLLDDAADRREAIIARQLTDRAAFLRLLTLLLELSGIDLGIGSADAASAFFGTAQSTGTDGSGLFEALMRAVAAGGSGLQDAHRLIRFLSAHGDEHDLMPEGFETLWSNAWQAHLELNGTGS